LNGTLTSIPVNAGTNQLTYASYDLNGNMTGGAGVTLTYDEANRVTSASPTSGGTEYYGYAPDNKRIYRLTPQTGGGWVENWTFYGAQGERLVTNMQLWGPIEVYSPQGQLTGWTAWFESGTSVTWFAGMMISDGNTVYQDRLGTNRAGGARFRPYGDEISSTTNDRVKFATYTRDSFSGLDYADQRFYASGYGRFNTADPYAASGGPNDPTSWNRYSYVQGDPVNHVDRRGLCTEDINGNFWDDWTEPWVSEVEEYTPGGCAGDAAYQLALSTVGAVLNGVFMMAQTAQQTTSTPPPPQCNYNPTTIPAAGFGTVPKLGYGYHEPINFNFSVSGAATGSTYVWANSQSVSISGTETTTAGTFDLGQLPPHTESLDDTLPSGSSANWFDAPGLAAQLPSGAKVTSANVTWNFKLTTSVIVNGQKVQCPTISWTASLNWRTVRGKPVVTGQPKIIGVTGP
jgi:RHS repeat-associated protein